MRRPRSAIVAASLVALVIGGAGCRATPSPVRVVGSPGDVSVLAGQWDGEYSSAETGRSGSISLRLVAGRDTAFGDVVMVPAGGARPLAPSATLGAPPPTATGRPAAGSQVLTITFVRVAHDSVSGALQPYEGPDCSCTLTTTFRGQGAGPRRPNRRDVRDPRPGWRGADGPLDRPAQEGMRRPGQGFPVHNFLPSPTSRRTWAS
jgi:hypothetical protein